jgi:hypothetical protein
MSSKQSNEKNKDTDADAIILRLRDIIRELVKENKELYKKLGLVYRPRIQIETEITEMTEMTNQ